MFNGAWQRWHWGWGGGAKFLPTHHPPRPLPWLRPMSSQRKEGPPFIFLLAQSHGMGLPTLLSPLLTLPTSYVFIMQPKISYVFLASMSFIHYFDLVASKSPWSYLYELLLSQISPIVPDIDICHWKDRNFQKLVQIFPPTLTWKSLINTLEYFFFPNQLLSHTTLGHFSMFSRRMSRNHKNLLLSLLIHVRGTSMNQPGKRILILSNHFFFGSSHTLCNILIRI